MMQKTLLSAVCLTYRPCMADIRKRKGPKGVKYQVRYPTSETKSGYTYASFDTLKEARAFSENLGSLPKRPSAGVITIPDAVTRWLDICEKIGRDGREKVEPETFKEYRRRGRVMRNTHGRRICRNWNRPTSCTSATGFYKQKVAIWRGARFRRFTRSSSR